MAEDLGPMNGETPSLVTHEQIKVQDFGKITHHFRGICLEFSRQKPPIDHNVYPVGLGNTRIWTDYTQKSPQTLPWMRLKRRFYGQNSITIGSCALRLGPLRTRAKSHDHEIVRAQKKVSKGHPNTPPTSCSVVMDPQV